MVDLFGGICILIGGSSFIGHILGKRELYEWHEGAPMAFNTSIVVMLQGVSTIIIVFYLVSRNNKNE